MRSDEWMGEYGHLVARQDEEIRPLILDGSVEICPGCRELSAYAWQDTTAYDEFDRYIPGGFQPAPGTIAHIGTSSCWEWECGHCRTHWMDADSPLNHPAYTHEED